MLKLVAVVENTVKKIIKETCIAIFTDTDDAINALKWHGEGRKCGNILETFYLETEKGTKVRMF